MLHKGVNFNPVVFDASWSIIKIKHVEKLHASKSQRLLSLLCIIMAAFKQNYLTITIFSYTIWE